jgi:hypothetical protein
MVLPGLGVTAPSGWSTTENTPSELNLVPPRPPNVALKFWLDMVTVKSSGPGRGTTVLKNVGGTSDALIAWLTHDHDFFIVSKPARVVFGRGITMIAFTVGVSCCANYGDPGCPANPRCADLFTSSYWGSRASYGIGGNGEVCLYLGTIEISGKHHTFLVAVDAGNRADLLRLENAATSILKSVRLPTAADSS